MRYAQLALGYFAGGEIQHEGSGARLRDANRKRVGAMSAVGPAPGSDDGPPKNVDKPNGHQGLLRELDGVLTNSTDVVAVPYREDAAALPPGALSGQSRRGFCNGLAVAVLTVQLKERSHVGQQVRGTVWLQPAFGERFDVAREQANTMRVVPSQVGLHQMESHSVSLNHRAAQCCHKRSDGGAQCVSIDQHTMASSLGRRPLLVRFV